VLFGGGREKERFRGEGERSDKREGEEKPNSTFKHIKEYYKDMTLNTVHH